MVTHLLQCRWPISHARMPSCGAHKLKTHLANWRLLWLWRQFLLFRILTWNLNLKQTLLGLWWALCYHNHTTPLCTSASPFPHCTQCFDVRKGAQRYRRSRQKMVTLLVLLAFYDFWSPKSSPPTISTDPIGRRSTSLVEVFVGL